MLLTDIVLLNKKNKIYGGKKMFKRNKILFLALALMLSVTLVACGGGSATPDPAPAPAPAPTPAPAPAPAPTPEPAKVDPAQVAFDRAGAFASERAGGQSFMISPADAAALVGNDDYFFLDVRRPADAYDLGHIEGAVNASFFDANALADHLDKLPMDKTILVLCYTGQTANQINGALNIAGFNAKAISGGASAWTKAELPLADTNNVYLVDMDAISSPASEEDEVAWDLAAAYIREVATKNPVIQPADLAGAVGDYNIMDIRNPKVDNYDEAHIEGAEYYDWADIAAQIESIPNDKPIVVHCWSGNNSGQTVAILKIAGYDALSLQGGFNNGWGALEDAVKDPVTVTK